MWVCATTSRAQDWVRVGSPVSCCRQSKAFELRRSGTPKRGCWADASGCPPSLCGTAPQPRPPATGALLPLGLQPALGRQLPTRHRSSVRLPSQPYCADLQGPAGAPGRLLPARGPAPHPPTHPPRPGPCFLLMAPKPEPGLCISSRAAQLRSLPPQPTSSQLAARVMGWWLRPAGACQRAQARTRLRCCSTSPAASGPLSHRPPPPALPASTRPSAGGCRLVSSAEPRRHRRRPHRHSHWQPCAAAAFLHRRGACSAWLAALRAAVRVPAGWPCVLV